MSLDGSYDMVLLPPRRDDNDGLRLARRRRALRQHLPAAEECNALNLGVEFFLLFSHQIRALLSFLFPRLLPLPNFKPV
jgi:hypothetical protein